MQTSWGRPFGAFMMTLLWVAFLCEIEERRERIRGCLLAEILLAQGNWNVNLILLTCHYLLVHSLWLFSFRSLEVINFDQFHDGNPYSCPFLNWNWNLPFYLVTFVDMLLLPAKIDKGVPENYASSSGEESVLWILTYILDGG